MREIGIDTRYYIPSRMEENYGLDKKTIDFINERDGKMVITVDTGANSIEDIRYAQGLGIEVIVTDHHKSTKEKFDEEYILINPKVITVDTGANSIEDIRYAQGLGIEVIVTDHHKSTKEKFDEEYILINPKLSENYKFKYLSGAGVALKLAQGIYRKLKISEERLYKYLDIVMIGTVADVVPMIDENRVIISVALKLAQGIYRKLKISEERLYKYLDIVMIGTVADVVPMIDENRVIISKGLQVLKETKVKGLVYLIRYLKFQNKNINTTDVSYFISPLINSLGRIGVSKIGADFFIEEDDFKIYNIIEEMKKTNKIRRKLEKKIYDEAIEILEKEENAKDMPYIFLTSKNWHPGVIGVVSSRLSIKFGVPVILVAIKNGVGKASCRSNNGVNIFNIFKKMESKLVRFGGHDLAAGFIAETGMLKEIEKEFAKEIEELKTTREEKILEVDLELSIDEINEEILEDIKLLSPYGLENQQPLFMDRGVYIKNIEKFGVEDRHFNGIIEKNKKEYPFIAFNLSNEIEHKNIKEKFDIVYYPEKVNIKGKDRYSIKIKGIK